MGQGTAKGVKTAEDQSDATSSTLYPPLANVGLYAPYGSPVEVGGYFEEKPKPKGVSTQLSYEHKTVDKDKIPFVFRWEYGGSDVQVCGSFTNWKTKIPLNRSFHGDFSTIIDLPRGVHEYKFFVDGKWIHDPNADATENGMGTHNNIVRVSSDDFKAYHNVDLLSTAKPSLSSSPSGDYSQTIPSRSSASGLPPHLPQLLQQTILNSDLPSDEDPTLLSEPNHVILNHLYALSVKDHVLVMACTHRYKEKFVTTLLYRPVS
jgi:5'-AMP-activated protein kinase regulatory beta subunit